MKRLRGRTILKLGSILIAAILLAAILVLFMSCGGGKHGAGITSRLGNSSAATATGIGSPDMAKSRTLSIEQAIAEVRAYAPPADATSSPGFDPAVFEMLRDELVRALEARKDEKICSAAATGDDVTIPDILVNPLPSGANEIQFSEVVTGDYDSSGEVGVPDITPIANHYLHRSDDGECDDALDRKIDGSGDGEVGIPDITPIAENYLMQSPAAGAGSDGYDVWRMPADGNGDAELLGNVTADVVQSGGEAGTTGYGETRLFSAVDADPVKGASNVRGMSGARGVSFEREIKQLNQISQRERRFFGASDADGASDEMIDNESSDAPSHIHR